MEKGLREFGERVGFLMPRIAREVIAKEMALLGMSEITFPQMIVLEFLREKGVCKMKDIAENFSVTTSAVTGLVDRMVKSDMITREADPDDRRVINVKLTENGKEAIGRIVKKRLDMIINVFGKLEQSEREAYVKILEKVYDIAKSGKK
jgi:DNA-binding MarR family transcriptional regulator